jgi:hypothetical protein
MVSIFLNMSAFSIFVGIRSLTKKEKIFEQFNFFQLLMPTKNTKWTNIWKKQLTSLDSTHLEVFWEIVLLFFNFHWKHAIFLFGTDQLTTIIGRLTDLTDRSTSGYRLNYVFYLQPAG